MDHEQRMAAVRQSDPVVAAAIVRNISQIEADCELAAGALSEQMFAEAVQAIGKVATSPWQVLSTKHEAQVVCPEWRVTRGVGIGDAWLELAEIGPEDVGQYSWICVAVRGGVTRMGLELTFRRGLQDVAARAIAGESRMAPLLKLGMNRDEENARLFFPIDIAGEILAQGFEMNDLTKALAPAGAAMKKAIAAKSELDKLIDEVRAEGKRK